MGLFGAAAYCLATESDTAPSRRLALTIYNQSFAVVRQALALDLKDGIKRVRVNDVTTLLEPDSVILRSLDHGRSFKVLEQTYRSDPISQDLVLSLYEGKTIDFIQTDKEGQKIIKGKVVRSGYVPPHPADTYPPQYQRQFAYSQGGREQPIVEVDGTLRFSLPGTPLFPSLPDTDVLKPTLVWEIQAERPGSSPAEFSYVTRGMNWHADYNVVAPPKGSVLDVVGWVTLDNQSGKSFSDASVKLMAGDVSKLTQGAGPVLSGGMASPIQASQPAVTERKFDEYHLYSLERRVDLHDHEIKQVEFLRAPSVRSQTLYVYDGVKIPTSYANYQAEQIRMMESYGTQSNTKVWVMQEFKNSSDNNLGIPLPKGRVRFYRRDADDHVEFTGENNIDHTPPNETVRLYTGNAFDVVGERVRTRFNVDSGARWIGESFEVRIRNHQKDAANVRVVEHLYRWANWDISEKSDPFAKVDAQTVEFTVQVPPEGEKAVTYTVHYSW